MNTATKPGLDAAKTASKIVVLKTAEGTGELIGNKIFEKLWNQELTWWEFRKFWRNSYYARAKARNIKRMMPIIVKWKSIKYQNY